MSQIRIFISSVQKEFTRAQASEGFSPRDPLFPIFDVFLFEDVPAIDRRADDSISTKSNDATSTSGSSGMNME